MDQLQVIDFLDEHVNAFYQWESDQLLRNKVGSTTNRSFQEAKERYFEYRKSNKLKIKSIVLNKQVIGRIELYIENHRAYIGIVIGDWTMHRKGYGSFALETILQDSILVERKIKEVRAEILTDNTESINFFIKNGFTKVLGSEELLDNLPNRILIAYERILG